MLFVLLSYRMQYVTDVSCVFSYLKVEINGSICFITPIFTDEETESIEIKTFRFTQLINWIFK